MLEDGYLDEGNLVTTIRGVTTLLYISFVFTDIKNSY